MRVDREHSGGLTVQCLQEARFKVETLVLLGP